VDQVHQHVEGERLGIDVRGQLAARLIVVEIAGRLGRDRVDRLPRDQLAQLG
jgi:hypothetical protein